MKIYLYNLTGFMPVFFVFALAYFLFFYAVFYESVPVRFLQLVRFFVGICYFYCSGMYGYYMFNNNSLRVFFRCFLVLVHPKMMPFYSFNCKKILFYKKKFYSNK